MEIFSFGEREGYDVVWENLSAGRWSRYCKFERDLSRTRSPRIRSILDPEEEFRPFAAPSKSGLPSRNLLDRSFLNASEEIFGSIVVGRLSRKLCFPLPVLLFSSPPPLWNPPREYFSLRKFDVRVDPFNGFILAGLENTLRDLDDSEIGEREREREIPCGE